MIVTCEPKYEGYEDLGSENEPGEDYNLFVDGQWIACTYWCGADNIADGERWASWGRAGLSMGHRTREDAERVQYHEFATNPDLYDRLTAQEAAEQAAAQAQREAEQQTAAEERRRRRCDNDDAPGEVLVSIPAYHAFYADYAEVRRVANWLDAHGLTTVSAVHEIRVEQREERRVIVYEAGLSDGATETRAATLAGQPPVIATPTRPELHSLLDYHEPTRFPLIDYGEALACGPCTSASGDPTRVVAWPCEAVRVAVGGAGR